MFKKIAIAGLIGLTLITAGCASNADVASDNLSKEADNFHPETLIPDIEKR